jgi:hypothetical protein
MAEHFGEKLDVKLWAEVFPVESQNPKEFSRMKGHKGQSLQIRQWSLVDVGELQGVVYQNVECSNSTVKVVGIGSSSGQMNKCWWININKNRRLEVEGIHALKPHLFTFQYPPLKKLIHARGIIDHWIDDTERSNQGKLVIFIEYFIYKCFKMSPQFVAQYEIPQEDDVVDSLGNTHEMLEVQNHEDDDDTIACNTPNGKKHTMQHYDSYTLIINYYFSW